MATLVYQGIKYVSDSNGYFKDKHNNNYLKFRPNIAFTVSNITLSPHLDYYVKRYTSTEVDLSLSHIHSTAKFVTITINDFNNKGHLNMPPAKIRFCPNAPELAVALDGEGYYTANSCKEVTSNSINLINASTLVTSDWLSKNKFKQISWRINDLKTGIALISWTGIDLNDTNYAATYPDTEIRFIAEWGSEYSGNTYTLSYKANGNNFGTPQTFSYSNDSKITITSSSPSKSGYIFCGWRIGTTDQTIANDDTIYPDYTAGSEMLCNKTNITLSAMWMKNNRETIEIHSGGGHSGIGNISLGGWDLGWFWYYPGVVTDIKNPTAVFINKTGVPKRLGYTFTGWKCYYSGGNNNGQATGKTKLPGERCNYEYENENGILRAQWSIAQEPKYNSNQTYSHTFDGQVKSYLLSPTVHTKYTITSNNNNQIIRIVNYIGETLTFIEDNIAKNPGSLSGAGATKTIALTPGTYYLEVGALASSGSNFRITKTTINHTITIDPNDKEDPVLTSHTFNGTQTFVGVSSGTSQPLANFSGGGVLTSTTYMKEPSHEGGKYQFKEWMSNPATIGKISLRTLSNQLIYTTSHVPNEDFTAKATWKPNTCYVVYNGNGSTGGHMSNSEHLYNIASSVFPNNYQKMTKIIFNSRGGTYSQSSDWNDSTYVDADSAARTMTITHLFNKWSTNANGTGTSYAGKEEGKCGSITFTDSAYGATKNLYAIWNLTTIQLPKVERAGFDFMGWYKADGSRAGGAGDSYAYGDTAEITLYAHWEPIGLVQIYTNDGWKYAIPYIYTYNDTTKTYEWKRAMSYVYNDSKWKQGAGSGQNMTNEQLEDL